MKRASVCITIFCWLFLFFVSVIGAAETVTISSKIVCSGCYLKKNFGAAAQCSIFGHKNAFLTPDGHLYNLLETEKSKEVINTPKYHNKSVEITSKIFHNANVLEIEKIKIMK